MEKKEGNGSNSSGRINKKNATIILIIAAIVIVAAVAGLYVLTRPSQQSPQFPWLYVGAYGVYNGTYTNANVTLNVSTRLQVVSFNSTTATVNQNLTETYANGTQITGSETSYYDLQSRQFILGSSYIPNGTYSGQYLYDNTERPCTIMQYLWITIDGIITYNVYYDNATSWIIAQNTTSSLFNSSLGLVSTNIPGL